MTITFTPVLLEHAPLCAALDGECFSAEVFSGDMITSLLKTPYVFGFLVLIGERPIGYTLASVAGKQGDLLTIGIIPEMQGKGYGRDSMIQLMRIATSKGIKELFLEVRPSNTSAIALYETFAASKEGLRKNYYSNELTGETEDALVMRIPV
ncbi:MAG: ribosomal-protein-alanine N-acetyltransferase [Alphaproteobacteria bacterium]